MDARQIVGYARDVNSNELAQEATKNAIENTVTWYLSDKLTDASMPIATKKYLTTDNKLVYLTRCNVAETTVPRIKVQVLERVQGGVSEVGYQIFADHRMTKYHNEMIFGGNASTPDGSKTEDVSEAEAGRLRDLLESLREARQTL